ncbi:hypothetical protein AD929_03305 [Gluconobacter potus]|uniref:Uncharacterized protein n=2 Tax=Gluconobacter potus TaxID=2724927 RepID=A0A149QYD2_9PROT|nr:hypothetical protein AD929_03305 [Gluconobacter potus]
MATGSLVGQAHAADGRDAIPVSEGLKGNGPAVQPAMHTVDVSIIDKDKVTSSFMLTTVGSHPSPFSNTSETTVQVPPGFGEGPADFRHGEDGPEHLGFGEPGRDGSHGPRGYGPSFLRLGSWTGVMGMVAVEGKAPDGSVAVTLRLKHGVFEDTAAKTAAAQAGNVEPRPFPGHLAITPLLPPKGTTYRNLDTTVALTLGQSVDFTLADNEQVRLTLRK